MALHALGSVDPASLVDARLQLHHASQFLAAFGGTLLEPRADDSHRTLNWAPSENRFYSESLEGLRAFLTPSPLAIGLARGTRDLSELKLMGATLRTAQAWMESAVRIATDNPTLTLDWPEYEMPAHFVLEGRPFQPKAVSMEELSRWFSGASAMLSALVDQEPDADPVRTWPHHFDIASLLVQERDDDSAPTRTVGVGMSPGDEGITEPYWYVNTWGHAEDAEFPELQAPGHTHREGWSGFVLTGSELIAAGREGRADPAGEGQRQAEALQSFLDRAVGAAKALFET